MEKLYARWFSCSVIILWLIVYSLGKKTDIVLHFANKGIAVIGREYYRYVSALFVHNHLLHVIANVLALFFVGEYLEYQISPVKLLVFSLAIGVIAEAIFSIIYIESVSIGGSPIVFSLIGLIVALQIMNADELVFGLDSWQCNWIAAYAVFANIPVFSNSFVSTLLIHGVPFGIGILLGCAGIALKLL